MNLVKKHKVPLLENTKLVAERDFGICIARIYENDILHAYFFSGAFVEIGLTEEVYQFNFENGNKSYLNLYEFEPNVDFAIEVRDWASDPNGGKNTIADALLIFSLPHKILANFYMNFNKPMKPTKIFNSRDKAIAWLLKQKI